MSKSRKADVNEENIFWKWEILEGRCDNLKGYVFYFSLIWQEGKFAKNIQYVIN